MKKKKKNIKESSAYSNDPTDLSRIVNGSYNISKVEDPIELKRLNNYLLSVFSASTSFQSKKEILNLLRVKLNHLGFDIDLPKSMRDTGETNLTLPLKRFGGIIGIDDKGQKLDNPHGPGPKLNIQITGSDNFLSANVVPAQSVDTPVTTPQATTEPEPVKESTFSNILNYFRRRN